MENSEFDGKIIHIYDSKIIRLLKKLGYLVIIISSIYLLTGIYVVGPDEVGMVKLLVVVRRVPPGIHYHIPHPFETIIKPKITEVRRVEMDLNPRAVCHDINSF